MDQIRETEGILWTSHTCENCGKYSVYDVRVIVAADGTFRCRFCPQRHVLSDVDQDLLHEALKVWRGKPSALDPFMVPIVEGGYREVPDAP